ncbi:MAG TPA: hypothetical protein PLN21_05155 [Gemmatales bacterium]|nr:hypothetical protein [Gemmatales bacterium]
MAYDYVLKGPVYLISDRRLPEGTQGWLASKWKGKEYPLLFSDLSIVNKYIIDAGKLGWMVIDAVDTPQQLLKVLQVMGSDGWKHLGIDADYKSAPKEILPLSATLKSLKAMLAEQN